MYRLHTNCPLSVRLTQEIRKEKKMKNKLLTLTAFFALTIVSATFALASDLSGYNFSISENQSLSFVTKVPRSSRKALVVDANSIEITHPVRSAAPRGAFTTGILRFSLDHSPRVGMPAIGFSRGSLDLDALELKRGEYKVIFEEVEVGTLGVKISAEKYSFESGE